MEESTSKEKILKKIRNALINSAEVPFPGSDSEIPLYKQSDESLDVLFAQEFTRAGGMFVYCEDLKELIDSLHVLLGDFPGDEIFCQEETIGEFLLEAGVPFCSSPGDMPTIKIGITGCECLVARLGSIMLTSAQAGGRKVLIYPESHIVIGFSWQLVPDIQQALALFKKKYHPDYPSLTTFITGPSRTADIEKTLVMGAHGPRNLYLFFVDKTN